MKDFFEDPKCHQMVRMLRKLVAEGPFNMRTFIFHSNTARRQAYELRDNLEKRGFIAVTEAAVRTSSDVEVAATKEGADFVAQIDATRSLQERAQRKAKPET